MLAGFVVAVMAAALAFSASRGAALALAAAVVLYGGALAAQGRVGRWEGVSAVILIAFAAGLSLWLGAGPLAEKLRAIGEIEHEPSLLSRVTGWQWTVKIITDHPLVGTGLGTFAEAWSRYYPPGTAGVWHEAHNDYLQLLSETGAAGFVIFLAATGMFAWRYLLAGVLGRKRGDPYAIHGVAIGLISAALHSVVDFPLQITACAALFVSLAGLLVAWRHRPEAQA
jgi:O-antigen ligase